MLSSLWAMERNKNKLFAKVLPFFLITQQSHVSWKVTLDREYSLRAQAKLRAVGKEIKTGGSPSPSIALPPPPPRPFCPFAFTQSRLFLVIFSRQLETFKQAKAS